MANEPNESQSIRPYSCDKCPKSFTRSENLQRHKRSRHGGENRRSIQCVGCHARFSRSDVHKRHSDRCSAALSLNEAAQPRLPVECTPHNMVNLAASLAIDRNTSESPLAPASLMQEQTMPTESSPLSYSSSAPSMPGEHIDTAHIKAYFDHFHPSFPFLHSPTFTVISTPKLLLKAVAIIGSLYSDSSFGSEEWESCANWRQRSWQNGQKELQDLVSANWSQIRQPWVMQAWLLYIIYGTYASNAAQFETAKQLLRKLVDLVRELGLSRQGIAIPDSLSWLSQVDLANPNDDSQTPYARWMAYIDSESMRLSLYTLVFLDSHVFSPCNNRPLMSPMELGWELPFPIALWEAQNPQIWLQRVAEHFGTSGFTIHDNFLHGPRGLATASLSIATQQLMAETPNTELLVALESSPTAMLFVITNLGALVRDFTRCYYQMRPSLSDPSAFHILTQLQNKQINTAVRAISKIVDAQAYANNNPHFHIWRAIELLVSSIKISLCRPDALLIGGIVDSSLIAGMAASTHLTLGSYVATRRSVTLLSHHAEGDEGILAILNDLSSALSKILEDDRDKVTYEAPWITVCNYNILLCIWGALRHANGDIRRHLDTFNELPRVSESCMLIFNTLMESTLRISKSSALLSRDPRLWSADRDIFATLLEESEPLFVGLIRNFCCQRSIWGIGQSMQTVLNEVQGTSNIITALA